MNRTPVLIVAALLACATQSAERRGERAVTSGSAGGSVGEMETTGSQNDAAITASVNREGDATLSPGEASSSANLDEGTDVRAAFSTTPERTEDDDDENTPSSSSVNREGDATFAP
jgi:hypothetical protein